MSTPTHILTGVLIGKALIAAGIPADPLRIMEVAIISANLPDIDIIQYGIRPAHHKSLLHKPFVWSSALFLLFVAAKLGVLGLPLPLLGVSALGICSHFILDTGCFTTGVQWLWPVSGHVYHYFPFFVRPASRRALFRAFITHAAFKAEVTVWVVCSGSLLVLTRLP